MDRDGANFHEALTRSHAVVGSSDRNFGLTFAAVMALIGGVKAWSGATSAPYWFGAALLFLALATLAPQLLAPLNRAWLAVGAMLYRVVNPVVLGLLFFAVVTPMALLLRAAGKRPLRLFPEPQAKTYWLERRPPGPVQMNRQF